MTDVLRRELMVLSERDIVVFRGNSIQVIESVIQRIRRGGIRCQVRTATVWQYGLPRTEHEVSVVEADERKALQLIGNIPQELMAGGVTRAQRIWIICSLSVILVVALVRLVAAL